MVRPAPIAFSRMKFTSDQEPEAMPVIMADCSRGNANEAAFRATIWKPPPMNVENEMSAMAIVDEVVQVAKPSVSEQTVSSRNRPIGRVLVAANLSAAQPQKK